MGRKKGVAIVKISSSLPMLSTMRNQKKERERANSLQQFHHRKAYFRSIPSQPLPEPSREEVNVPSISRTGWPVNYVMLASL